MLRGICTERLRPEDYTETARCLKLHRRSMQRRRFVRSAASPTTFRREAVQEESAVRKGFSQRKKVKSTFFSFYVLESRPVSHSVSHWKHRRPKTRPHRFNNLQIQILPISTVFRAERCTYKAI